MFISFLSFLPDHPAITILIASKSVSIAFRVLLSFRYLARIGGRTAIDRERAGARNAGARVYIYFLTEYFIFRPNRIIRSGDYLWMRCSFCGLPLMATTDFLALGGPPATGHCFWLRPRKCGRQSPSLSRRERACGNRCCSKSFCVLPVEDP